MDMGGFEETFGGSHLVEMKKRVFTICIFS